MKTKDWRYDNQAAIRVELGNECLLGANVTIADTDFHAIKLTGLQFNKTRKRLGVHL